ncbi:hypothetical protein F5Y07DRAFT_45817 [Xylaria sp. FL0933]|nr:hypothetical protein F5Y07DRAFT_45817 [Xylaria sp. FL0933]
MHTLHEILLIWTISLYLLICRAGLLRLTLREAHCVMVAGAKNGALRAVLQTSVTRTRTRRLARCGPHTSTMAVQPCGQVDYIYSLLQRTGYDFLRSSSPTSKLALMSLSSLSTCSSQIDSTPRPTKTDGHGTNVLAAIVATSATGTAPLAAGISTFVYRRERKTRSAQAGHESPLGAEYTGSMAIK